MKCKLLDCEAEAIRREVSPYGYANLCGVHGTAAAEHVRSDAQQAVWTGLLHAFTYGPKEDPPLTDEFRHGEFARPDGIPVN